MKNGHNCTYQMQRYYFLTKTNTSSSTISENEKEFLHRNMEILLTGIRICRVLTRHAYKHAIIDHFICIMATNQPRPAPLLSAFACSLGSPFIHFFSQRSKQKTCPRPVIKCDFSEVFCLLQKHFIRENVCNVYLRANRRIVIHQWDKGVARVGGTIQKTQSEIASMLA